MPGGSAQRGDIYEVHRNATREFDQKVRRRVVCVAELPDESTWRAMARITTANQPGDLPSPQQNELKLTRPGWWTTRFIRAVRKDLTGRSGVCDYKSTLPEPLRTAVLAHYMNRPRPRT